MTEKTITLDTPVAPTPAEPKPFESVADMGAVVVDWFRNCHQQLSALQQLPEAMLPEIVDQDTGEVHKLTDAEVKVFKMGIAVAQSIISDLPFQVITQDEPTA